MFVAILLYNNTEPLANTIPSYPGMIVINEDVYLYKGETNNNFKLDTFIGTISKRVNPKSKPRNFESNILDKGTKLYTVHGEKDIIVALKSDKMILFIKE